MKKLICNFGLAAAWAVLCLLFPGCGSTPVFTPASGIFEGKLLVAGEELGSFNYTVTGNLIGGTGSLDYLGGPITLALSGSFSDRAINGGIANNLGGTGPFVGTFQSERVASGTFSFVDLNGTNEITGTWTAIEQPL